MAATYNRWMAFVDGENLTLRAEERAKRLGNDALPKAAAQLYRRGVCFWPKQEVAGHVHLSGWWKKFVHTVHVSDYAERCSYYTCVTSDQDGIAEVHDQLQAIGFHPVVLKKVKGLRAKGVDISLTRDVLVHAFFNNYDIAVLVTGDGDYVPVIEEIRRFGKRVVVAFFGDQDGLNPQLRRAADDFVVLDDYLK